MRDPKEIYFFSRNFTETTVQPTRTSSIRKQHLVMFGAVLAALAAFSQFAHADSGYASNWGPSIGTTAPVLSAVDQDGNVQNLQSLSNDKGLLFVFNRSVDW